MRLPSFSLQPSDYILKLGEHLLSLVAQLTPFAKRTGVVFVCLFFVAPVCILWSTWCSFVFLEEASDSEASVNTDTLYWLSMVGSGVAAELVKRIQGIPHLSEQGGKQLACDIEYLANVKGTCSHKRKHNDNVTSRRVGSHHEVRAVGDCYGCQGRVSRFCVVPCLLSPTSCSR